MQSTGKSKMKLSKIFLISLSFLIALFSLTACVYPLNSTDINSDNNTGSSQDAENFDADRPTVNDGSETNGDTDVLVLSLVNGLNIRLGAGTNYPSLGTLDIPQNSFAKFSIRPLTTFINIIAKHYKQSFDIKHKITAIQKPSYILDFI